MPNAKARGLNDTPENPLKHSSLFLLFGQHRLSHAGRMVWVGCSFWYLLNLPPDQSFSTPPRQAYPEGGKLNQ